MSTPRPAHVVAELVVGCADLDGTQVAHRVWITRTGAVLTPDHASSEEDVLTALGGHLTHPCAYWLAVPRLTQDTAGTPLTPPARDTWTFTDTDPLWTQKATWAALTGLLGTPTFTMLDPTLALTHIRAFLAQRAAVLPEDTASHLGYLQAPWTRAGGYRRTRPTTAAELAALLAAGIPVTRVASAAALGATPIEAVRALTALTRLGLPADTLINLLYALPPDRAADLAERLSQDTAAVLAANLTRLKDTAADLDDAGIEAFLLTA